MKFLVVPTWMDPLSLEVRINGVFNLANLAMYRVYIGVIAHLLTIDH